MNGQGAVFFATLSQLFGFYSWLIHAYPNLRGYSGTLASKSPSLGRLVRSKGGSIMRIIFAFAILASSLALGGCFHHNQAAYAEPLPPMAHPPLK